MLNIRVSVSLKSSVCNLNATAMNVFNEAIKVLLFIIKNINPQTFYNTYTCAYK
jgi:hypothetical protein